MAHSVAPAGSQPVAATPQPHDQQCRGEVVYLAIARYHRPVPSSQPPSAAPVDPPIPVPDVPGADAGARGLPRRVDLTLRQRLIVDSSAIADLGLRTALASIVGAAMLPQVALAALNGSGAKEQREALQFYAEQIGRAHV